MGYDSSVGGVKEGESSSRTWGIDLNIEHQEPDSSALPSLEKDKIEFYLNLLWKMVTIIGILLLLDSFNKKSRLGEWSRIFVLLFT